VEEAVVRVERELNLVVLEVEVLVQTMVLVLQEL
jgi:hypothetical protein